MHLDRTKASKLISIYFLDRFFYFVFLHRLMNIGESVNGTLCTYAYNHMGLIELKLE